MNSLLNMCYTHTHSFYSESKLIRKHRDGLLRADVSCKLENHSLRQVSIWTCLLLIYTESVNADVANSDLPIMHLQTGECLSKTYFQKEMNFIIGDKLFNFGVDLSPIKMTYSQQKVIFGNFGDSFLMNIIYGVSVYISKC